MKINALCVYCGSSPGRSPAFLAAAQELGTEIARRGMRLVYGGASVGLMGEVARAVLAGGGKVTGVITQTLAEQEVVFKELDDLIVVDSMHKRKARMFGLADGFIAMPGGFGTFEELFEVLTWAQLGMHTKPCGLLNIENYFAHLQTFLDHAVSEMFIHAPHREMVLSASTAGDLIDQMTAYDRVPVKKTDWVRAMGKTYKE
ncbi:MAG: TIGR00730 family Rossman fold protein [Pelolinea sp.]|nr:TIGR00730 family Rossman fold protein [Pelolinea sp.]